MTRTFQVTFDAHDPAGLATFWAEALGYQVELPPDGFATWADYADEIGLPMEDRNSLAAAIDPVGDGPRLLFQMVPESKTAKNRVHLDIDVADPTGSSDERNAAIDAEVARLVDLGATKIAVHGSDHQTWTVMQDPEGNEFCVQ
jgi:hypothetical protein